MNIADIVAMATAGFGDTAARMRRAAIAYGICGFCALVAVIMATSASLLALEAAVGAIYARLIVAGVFVLVASSIVLAIRLRQPRRLPPPQAAPLGAAAGPKPQFSQIAMIVEAVMLGYSLSRKSGRR